MLVKCIFLSINLIYMDLRFQIGFAAGIYSSPDRGDFILTSKNLFISIVSRKMYSGQELWEGAEEHSYQLDIVPHNDKGLSPSVR